MNHLLLYKIQLIKHSSRQAGKRVKFKVMIARANYLPPLGIMSHVTIIHVLVFYQRKSELKLIPLQKLLLLERKYQNHFRVKLARKFVVVQFKFPALFSAWLFNF